MKLFFFFNFVFFSNFDCTFYVFEIKLFDKTISNLVIFD